MMVKRKRKKKGQQALGMWSCSLHPITYNLLITVQNKGPLLQQKKRNTS